jgi:hypothetical protein
MAMYEHGLYGIVWRCHPSRAHSEYGVLTWLENSSMKYLRYAVLVLSAIVVLSAFVSAARAEGQGLVSSQEFSAKNFELSIPSGADAKVLTFDKGERQSDAGFVLIRVTWNQYWVLVQQKVKLASIAGMKTEWFVLKHGDIGPILGTYDGVPAMLLKDKSDGKLKWCYFSEEIPEVQTFWIAVSSNPANNEKV